MHVADSVTEDTTDHLYIHTRNLQVNPPHKVPLRTDRSVASLNVSFVYSAVMAWYTFDALTHAAVMLTQTGQVFSGVPKRNDGIVEQIP